MAKPKSGYKRRPYQRPDGVKIPVKTQDAWNLLNTVAKASGLPLGKWAETRLIYARSGDPYIPPAKPLIPNPTVLPTPRGFKISEGLFDDIVIDKGEDGAGRWISATLIALALIELERLRGVSLEPDRFE